MDIDRWINRVADGERVAQSRWTVACLWIVMAVVAAALAIVMLLPIPVTIPVTVAGSADTNLRVLVPSEYANLINAKHYQLYLPQQGRTVTLAGHAFAYNTTLQQWVLSGQIDEQMAALTQPASLILAEPPIWQLFKASKAEILRQSK